MAGEDTLWDRTSGEQIGHDMTAAERLPLHYASLARHVELTFVSDGKAGFFLALNIVMVSTSASRLNAITNAFSGGHVTPMGLGIAASAALSLLSSLIAVVYSISVVYPRLAHAAGGITYFGAIAGTPFPTFRERVLALTSEEHEDDVLQQIHGVSGIALRKILLLRRVTFLSILAGAAWIVFIFLTT